MGVCLMGRMLRGLLLLALGGQLRLVELIMVGGDIHEVSLILIIFSMTIVHSSACIVFQQEELKPINKPLFSINTENAYGSAVLFGLKS